MTTGNGVTASVCSDVCLCRQIANSGVELIVSTSASGSQTVTVSRSGMEAVSFAVTSPSAGDDRKRSAPRVVDSLLADRKMEFDRRLAAFSEWLDHTEGLLELVKGGDSAADTQARLTVEEQLVLVEVSVWQSCFATIKSSV